MDKPLNLTSSIDKVYSEISPPPKKTKPTNKQTEKQNYKTRQTKTKTLPKHGPVMLSLIYTEDTIWLLLR